MKMLLIILLSLSYSYAVPILIIGQSSTKDATYTLAKITPEEYAQTIIIVNQAFEEQMIPELKNIEATKSAWKFNKFTVGVSANGEIGFGPFKYGKVLRQRFGYTR